MQCSFRQRPKFKEKNQNNKEKVSLTPKSMNIYFTLNSQRFEGGLTPLSLSVCIELSKAFLWSGSDMLNVWSIVSSSKPINSCPTERY